MRPSSLSPLRRALTRAAAVFALLSTTTDRASSVCTEPLLFAPGVEIGTGPRPLFLASGDFNEDGRLDLAVTNSNWTAGGDDATVAVLFGSGDGLALSAAYPVGQNPHGVVAADFNEDGILDLAVANKWGESISVLLGAGSEGVGNGFFSIQVVYPAGGQPFKLVAADLNEDGILDLVTAINDDPAVHVLPGLGAGGVGDGTFGAPVAFAIGGLSRGVAAADLNEDGHVDLVATEYQRETVAVLLGTGAGTIGAGSFAAPVSFFAGIDPFDVIAGHVNADDDLDLVVANTTGGGTAVLLGNGSGFFLHTTTLDSGNTGGAALIDANQDGNADVIACSAQPGTGSLAVFLGTGTGSFGPGSHYPAGGFPYQVAVGDFTGDEQDDAVTSHYLEEFVTLFPGGCLEGHPDLRYPVLTDVRDVPNDEGGRVFLTWTASSLDVNNGPVIQYRVWRRVHPASLPSSFASLARERGYLARPASGPSGTQIEYWEALATLPAQRLEGYGYTAATTQDSMPQSNPYTAFFVSALTSNINVFYSSNVDSGYSADNIPPYSPELFAGEASGEAGFALSWEAHEAPDFQEFRLYRGDTPDFVPSEGSLLAVTTGTSYVDAEALPYAFYKLAAVDEHENSSDPAVVVRGTPTGVDGPVIAFALQGVSPHPARTGRFTVHFSLPSSEPARLELISVQGRRVLSQDVSLGVGHHSVELGTGQRIAPGVYFVRLRQGARTLEGKAVVLQQ